MLMLAFQVKELFEKIQKMMEANKRPREVQYRMYSQARQDVGIKEKRQGARGNTNDSDAWWEANRKEAGGLRIAIYAQS